MTWLYGYQFPCRMCRSSSAARFTCTPRVCLNHRLPRTQPDIKPPVVDAAFDLCRGPYISYPGLFFEVQTSTLPTEKLVERPKPRQFRKCTTRTPVFAACTSNTFTPLRRRSWRCCEDRIRSVLLPPYGSCWNGSREPANNAVPFPRDHSSFGLPFLWTTSLLTMRLLSIWYGWIVGLALNVVDTYTRF